MTYLTSLSALRFMGLMSPAAQPEPLMPVEQIDLLGYLPDCPCIGCWRTRKQLAGRPLPDGHPALQHEREEPRVRFVSRSPGSSSTSAPDDAYHFAITGNSSMASEANDPIMRQLYNAEAHARLYPLQPNPYESPRDPPSSVGGTWGP